MAESPCSRSSNRLERKRPCEEVSGICCYLVWPQDGSLETRGGAPGATEAAGFTGPARVCLRRGWIVLTPVFLQRQIPFSTASSLLNQGRVCCARAVASIVLGEGSPLKDGPGRSCPRLPLSRSHARPFLGDVTHGGDRGAAGQSTHGCTGQSPLPGGLPAANLIHFLPATSPRCDSSLSSDLRPLPAPTGLCVPSPHRPRPRCRVHGGVPGRVVVHSAVCMGTGRGASGRALRPRAFRVPDVSTPALRRCWRGGGGHKPPTACAGSRAPRSLQQRLCAVAPPAPWAGSRRQASEGHLSVHSKLGDCRGQAPSAVQEAEG